VQDGRTKCSLTGADVPPNPMPAIAIAQRRPSSNPADLLDVQSIAHDCFISEAVTCPGMPCWAKAI
jgi:hypothetical protein